MSSPEPFVITSNIEANVLVLPNGKTSFQQSFVDASDHPGGRAPHRNATIRVSFEKPFKTPPKVCDWFTELSIPMASTASGSGSKTSRRTG
ncbi:unnamed protein product, partial [Clonostachys rosea f. rosea IK726]